MRWSWRRQGRTVEPRLTVSRTQKPETVKEILAEVFHTRPSKVEEISHEATVRGVIV